MKSCFLIGFSVLMTFWSCSNRTFDSKEELMSHVTNPENQYTHHKNINGIDYEVTYRPTDILVQQELGDNGTKKQLDSLRNKYGKYLYFNLFLSKNDQEVLNSMSTNRADFGAMVNQLAFGMGDKIHLFSQSKDTINLLDYVYPREYGMSGATNIMFVYPRDQKLLENEFFHFTIDDIGLKTGEVGFKIPTEIIKNEPRLDFSTIDKT